MARKPKDQKEKVWIRMGRYVLSADANNWMIQQEFKNDDGPYYQPVKFYPTLTSAITGMLELRLRTSDAKTLEDLRSEIASFKLEVEQQLGTTYASTGPEKN